METPVYNRFNSPECSPFEFEGEDLFEPDQALTIQEILLRAHRGVLRDVTTQPEIPDDVGEFYDDLTDMLEPRSDDVSELE